MPDDDLRQIREMIADLQRDDRCDLEESMRRVLRDEIKQTIRAEVEDMMDRIGLRVDDAHREETADAIRGLLRFHRRADRIVGHIVMTFFASLFFGLMGLLGWNLKGTGHP